ncbi:MAG: beta-galactosidase family protein [Bacteroidota bacterium]
MIFRLPFAALLLCAFVFAASRLSAQGSNASFSYDTSGFYLNGKPFQVWSGEMHFQRIPRLYWRDRLLKAKALGLNTVATYVFWNALEPKMGQWNFQEQNDLAAFIREAKSLGLYVILRPGPYACAEWDFGGLPSWLLAKPGIKVRCSDPDYLRPALNYIDHIAEIVQPYLISKGGNVIMVQVENEYGSFGNDAAYLLALRDAWRNNGIDVPLSTSDGATPYMLEAGSIPGCVVGLDPGANEGDFKQAKLSRPDVPAFCGEYYPGWLTHWGEPWARADTVELLHDLEWLIQNKKSWNLYVLHGGTNFGFYAGANFSDVYQPDITSYDYDAPIREDGTLTPKYFAIRRLLAKYQQGALPPLPAPVIKMDINPVTMTPFCSVFDKLPQAIVSPQPKPMEQFGQDYGFILYRTTLNGHHSGKLTLTDLHDYATVYLDGKYVGVLDRTKKVQSIDLPQTNPPGKQLDILVEGMGRINFGSQLIDPKGITNRVTLNGLTLMNWQVFPLPMDQKFMSNLANPTAPSDWSKQPGQFFKGSFYMATLGDTYLDLSGWEKGVVWVNGHNLGRYWNLGPQQHLYLPGAFMIKGRNEIIIFDLHKKEGGTVKGVAGLE